MPGDPISGPARAHAGATRPPPRQLTGYYTEAFGLDEPLWEQYLDFWRGALPGRPRPEHRRTRLVGHRPDLGRRARTRSRCWCRRSSSASSRGNRVGALAARRQGARQHRAAGLVPADRDAVHVARDRARLLRRVRSWAGCPMSGAYDFSLQPEWTLGVRPQLPEPLDPAVPLALPRRVRRLGDRDAQPDHLRARGRLRATTSQSLGAPSRLVRRYAYRNAVLPQMTGLALALGRGRRRRARDRGRLHATRASARMILTAIQNRDYFLLQGVFLFIIVGVLIANFIVDIALRASSTRGRALGIQGQVSTLEPAVEQLEAATGARSAARRARRRGRRREWLYFALRNPKLVIGARRSSLAVLALAVLGPWLTDADPFEFGYGTGAAAVVGALARHDRRPARTCSRSSSTGCARASSSARSAAAIAAIIGMVVGFVAGYRGGARRRAPEHAHERRARDPDARGADHHRRLPERARARDRGDPHRADVVAVGGARVRAQTFSLVSRDFVSLARLSRRGRHARDRRARSRRTWPPTSSSIFILLFGGSILIGAYARLHRPRPDERDVARR